MNGRELLAATLGGPGVFYLLSGQQVGAAVCILLAVFLVWPSPKK